MALTTSGSTVVVLPRKNSRRRSLAVPPVCGWMKLGGQCHHGIWIIVKCATQCITFWYTNSGRSLAMIIGPSLLLMFLKKKIPDLVNDIFYFLASNNKWKRQSLNYLLAVRLPNGKSESFLRKKLLSPSLSENNAKEAIDHKSWYRQYAPYSNWKRTPLGTVNC